MTMALVQESPTVVLQDLLLVLRGFRLLLDELLQLEGFLLLDLELLNPVLQVLDAHAAL